MTTCLFKMALVTPLVHIEDLYITGILAEKCGFRKGNIPGFYKTRIDPCNFQKEIVLVHNIRAEEQQLMQDIVSKKSSSEECTWLP
jgi:hypothetical protein